MLIPLRPPDEQQRLRELHELDILDSEDEKIYDDLVKLGSYISGCPISLISLIDDNRQWFKARRGLDIKEVPRDISFCAHTILQNDAFVIENTLADARFLDNPAVAGDPNFRFYAGLPLVTKNGFRIGTFCTIDYVPKKMSDQQLDLLATLARQAAHLIEKRRTQRHLQMIHHNSKTLFDKSPLIITSTRGPEHVFDYVNTQDSKLLGSTNATGKSILEVQPEAGKTGFLQVFNSVFQHGQTQSLKDSCFIVGSEVRHFDLVLTPRHGLNGKIDGTMGIIDDITDRRCMELELKKFHEQRDLKFHKMAAMLERVPISIASIEGPEHRFVFANKLYRAFFPHIESLEGKRIIDIIPEAQQQGYIDRLDRVYTTGEPYVSKEDHFVQQLPDGSSIKMFIDITYEAIRGACGNITGVLMAIANITEEVNSRLAVIEKAEQLSHEKVLLEDFVGTLSQDLHTPLQAAKSLAEHIVRTPSGTTDIQAVSDKIIINIDRTTNMVRNLLDANRIKAGEPLPVVMTSFCLNDLIEQVTADAAVTSGRIISVRAQSGPIQGAWDKEAIGRALQNLLSNAINYSSADTPIVVAIDQGHEAINIAVQNQGSMIAKDDMATLFDAHTRLESAADGKRRGWGIGLALVKGIAQAHGGTIGVRSSKHQGTVFTLKLPKAAPPAP